MAALITPLWKWTDANHQTRGNTQWGPGVEHQASGIGELCSSGWLHAYEDPLLAVLMDPAHGEYARYGGVLWTAQGVIGKSGGTKCGCIKLATIAIILVPVVNRTQRVAFGILAAKQFPQSSKWEKWAEQWLSGKDRTVDAADAAASAAAAYAAATAYTAADAASAASAAAASTAVTASADAAATAYTAADAASAASAAAAKKSKIDFSALARAAMEVK